MLGSRSRGLAFPETILCLPAEFSKVGHSPSSFGLPPLSLWAPVIVPGLLLRETAAPALAFLKMIGPITTASAEAVVLGMLSTETRSAFCLNLSLPFSPINYIWPLKCFSSNMRC